MSTEKLENVLWDSANKLRGGLAAADYMHVVLGLIFLKYLSDKFDVRYKELVDEFVNHFGYKFATDDNFKIYGYHFYKQIGADKLRALSRFIREGSHKLSKNNHKMAFYDCIKELYGVELGDCLATRGI